MSSDPESDFFDGPSIEEDLIGLQHHLGEVRLQWAAPIAERIARGVGGRELSLCMTRLQEAEFWAGLSVLERKGKQ